MEEKMKEFQDMIILADLQKRFGDFVAVNNLSVKVKKGEYLTLLGPSGCGKTTTLRMIAGFEDPTSGSILISGRHAEHLPPNKREVNTVFQNYALFPHLNIRENIGFGLKIKKVKRDEIKQRVEEVIKMVKLEEHADKNPSQLSGGQKQRVAIARAIINRPKVLLLDEPLGALDLKLRKAMQIELKQLQRKLGITFVYVTHDQEEALTMSDRIIVMNKGNLEQIGTAEEIYQKPKTKFVADFIGETNLIDGKILEVKDKIYTVSVDGIPVKATSDESYEEGRNITISLRPENIHIVTGGQRDDRHNYLEVSYRDQIYIGNIRKIIVALPSGKELVVSKFAERAGNFQPNDKVLISWNKEKSVLIKD